MTGHAGQSCPPRLQPDTLSYGSGTRFSNLHVLRRLQDRTSCPLLTGQLSAWGKPDKSDIPLKGCPVRCPAELRVSH